jgi:hypothetical protein
MLFYVCYVKNAIRHNQNIKYIERSIRDIHFFVFLLLGLT